MSESKKVRVELGYWELAYGIRAFNHLAEAYSNMDADSPAVDAVHKQMVTILKNMSVKFGRKLGELQASSK